MKWQEVRELYPNQFVKFKVLGLRIIRNIVNNYWKKYKKIILKKCLKNIYWV